MDDSDRTQAGDVTATYDETDDERVLAFERDGRRAVLAQNVDGYAMVAVRAGAPGAETERERYYGLEMALDHAAEVLGVEPGELPVPETAADMGM